MMRSALSFFLLGCLLSLTAVAQSIPNLSEADKKERLSLEVEDLVGPIKIVAVQETQLTATKSTTEQSESERKHIRSVLFDSEGKITDVVKLGRVRLRCSTQATENSEPKWTERFDASGRKVEATEENYDPLGRLMYRNTYRYEPQQNVSSQSTTIFYPDGKVAWKWGFKFDVQGRQIERSTYGESGVLSSREVLIRNDKGLVIESAEHSSTGSSPVTKTSMSYEFDDFGNWITCTQSRLVTENGETFFRPSKRIYRTLTYYSPQ